MEYQTSASCPPVDREDNKALDFVLHEYVNTNYIDMDVTNLFVAMEDATALLSVRRKHP